MLGLIIGAIFVEFASWRWVFWFVALVAIPVALSCVLLIPAAASQSEDLSLEPQVSKWKSLDLGGVSILTGGYSSMTSLVVRRLFNIQRYLSRLDLIHLCCHIWIYGRMGICYCSCAFGDLYLHGRWLLLL